MIKNHFINTSWQLKWVLYVLQGIIYYTRIILQHSKPCLSVKDNLFEETYYLLIDCCLLSNINLILMMKTSLETIRHVLSLGKLDKIGMSLLKVTSAQWNDVTIIEICRIIHILSRLFVLCFCVIFFRLLYSMLAIYLDCPLLIAPFVFSLTFIYKQLIIYYHLIRSVSQQVDY